MWHEELESPYCLVKRRLIVFDLICYLNVKCYIYKDLLESSLSTGFKIRNNATYQVTVYFKDKTDVFANYFVLHYRKFVSLKPFTVGNLLLLHIEHLKLI